MANPDLAKLESIAREGRAQIIRMLTHAGSGHPGGSLSVIDILTTLFFNRMRYDPKRPHSEDTDRFVLSKGTACPPVILHGEGGFFPMDRLITRAARQPLQGIRPRDAAGSRAATGSLGQDPVVATGMAPGEARRQERAVYCVVGDGATQEGQILESLMSAPKLGRPIITWTISASSSTTRHPARQLRQEDPRLEPVTDKLKAFGWPGARGQRPRHRAGGQGAGPGGGHRSGPRSSWPTRSRGRVCLSWERPRVARQGAQAEESVRAIQEIGVAVPGWVERSSRSSRPWEEVMAAKSSRAAFGGADRAGRQG